MKNSNLRRIATTLCCLAALASSITVLEPVVAGGSAQAQERRETIRFAPGRSGATLRGKIRGDESVSYRIKASAGQRLVVDLRTSNPSNYFNVSREGASEALFIGSSEGNRLDMALPSGGAYIIDVYLMRNAARRNESAAYTLSVRVTGAAGYEDGGGYKPAPQPDFADSLAGGPDFWQVDGVPPGDTLSIRTAPSARAPLAAEVRNGTILRNLGCRISKGQRWCRVERRNGSAAGWAAGRYLIEGGQ